MPQTNAEAQQAATEFYSFAEFTRKVCLCIIILRSDEAFIFCQQGEGYRNRKGYFSLNVQTISSANLKVMKIVSRWPGATHDQTIFRQSLIHDRFQPGDFVQYILVGDSGYDNTSFLTTPFTATNIFLQSIPTFKQFF